MKCIICSLGALFGREQTSYWRYALLVVHLPVLLMQISFTVPFPSRNHHHTRSICCITENDFLSEKKKTGLCSGNENYFLRLISSTFRSTIRKVQCFSQTKVWKCAHIHLVWRKYAWGVHYFRAGLTWKVNPWVSFVCDSVCLCMQVMSIQGL